MINQILADYYEERSFVNKAQRLRNHKPAVIFGYYLQYNMFLGIKIFYGYSKNSGFWGCHYNYYVSGGTTGNGTTY